MHILTITAVGALVVAVIATITDLRSGKIYNWLTLPAMLLGMIARAVEYGMNAPDAPVPAAVAGFCNGLLGWFLGMLIYGIFKVFMRHFGGGDVKLMGALGAFLGPFLIFSTFIYHAFVFGIYTCIVLASAFPWRQFALAYVTKDSKVLSMEKFNQARKAPLPVAPIIAIGLVAALCLQEQTKRVLGF